MLHFSLGILERKVIIFVFTYIFVQKAKVYTFCVYLVLMIAIESRYSTEHLGGGPIRWSYATIFLTSVDTVFVSLIKVFQ